MDKYTYDVAFSFLAEDEIIALQLYEILDGPISCFIYSEEQKRLAGKDGEKEFNSVFGKEARAVVVLYRDGWGKTAWTRIEETAIRNRAHDEGYDFVLFIPLGKVDPPKWLPKNRIWIGLERWGIENAAAVIEARVQELDGIPKIESIADKTARKSREIKRRAQRESLLGNMHGLKLANDELNAIIAGFESEVDNVKKNSPEWHIRIQKNQNGGIDLISYGYHLTIQWCPKASNTPRGSYLFLSLFDGVFDERGTVIDPFNVPTRIATERLQFDIDKYDQPGWSLKETRKGFRTSRNVIDYWLNQLIEFAAKKRET